MTISSKWILPIALLSLLSPSTHLAQAATPGLYEIDLLFPRNDTYAPTYPFPIIFSVQNSALTGPIGTDIFWQLSPVDNATGPGYTPFGSILHATDNFTYDSITSLSDRENTWLLQWQVVQGRVCAPSQGSSPSYDIPIHSLMFTTRVGAQAPNFGNPVPDGTCSAIAGTAINVTDVAAFPYAGNNAASCAVFGALPTTTNPCAAATIGSAAAASITAAYQSEYLGGTNGTRATPTPTGTGSVLSSVNPVLVSLALLVALFGSRIEDI